MVSMITGHQQGAAKISEIPDIENGLGGDKNFFARAVLLSP
jgi:hypothetical protein